MSDEPKPSGYALLRRSIQHGADPLQTFFHIVSVVAHRGPVGTEIPDAARYLLECYRVARLFVSVATKGLDQCLLSFARADSNLQRSELDRLWREELLTDYLIRVGLLGDATSEYVKRHGAKGLP